MDDLDNDDGSFFHGHFHGPGHFQGPFQDAFKVFASFPFGFLNAAFSDGSQENIISFDGFEPPRSGSYGFSSLRDSMLKQPDSYEEQEITKQTLPTVSRFFPSFQNQESQETDLVQKTMSEGETLFPKTTKPSFFRSSFTSVIRTADGKIEEQHTICDSNGQEEKTVKRVLGDKVHTITTKKLSDGKEEVTENMLNIDKDMLPDFNASWQSPQVYQSPAQQHQPQTEYHLMNGVKRFFDFLTGNT